MTDEMKRLEELVAARSVEAWARRVFVGAGRRSVGGTVTEEDMLAVMERACRELGVRDDA